MLLPEGVIVGGVGHAFPPSSFLFVLFIGDRHAEGLDKFLKDLCGHVAIKHFYQDSALLRRYVGCLISKAVYRIHDLIMENGLLRA